MSDRVSIRLAAQAKIDGKWRKPGEDVSVTADELRHLVNAGAVDDSVDLAELAPGYPGFDEAVAATAKVLADAGIEAAVEVALAEVTRDRDEFRALQQVAENQVNRLEARILELENELNKSEEVRQELETQLQAANSSAPKTASKKGVGAKQG